VCVREGERQKSGAGAAQSLSTEQRRRCHRHRSAALVRPSDAMSVVAQERPASRPAATRAVDWYIRTRTEPVERQRQNSDPIDR